MTPPPRAVRKLVWGSGVGVRVCSVAGGCSDARDGGPPLGDTADDFLVKRWRYIPNGTLL